MVQTPEKLIPVQAFATPPTDVVLEGKDSQSYF